MLFQHVLIALSNLFHPQQKTHLPFHVGSDEIENNLNFLNQEELQMTVFDGTLELT